MLPTFITEDTAERILFMGRIVWIVRNDPKVSQKDHYETKRKRDIWDGKDIEYYRKVQALETQTFNQVEFQRTIEECRVRLTKVRNKIGIRKKLQSSIKYLSERKCDV